jgi:hypothetical protein
MPESRAILVRLALRICIVLLVERKKFACRRSKCTKRKVVLVATLFSSCTVRMLRTVRRDCTVPRTTNIPTATAPGPLSGVYFPQRGRGWTLSLRTGHVVLSRLVGLGRDPRQTHGPRRPLSDRSPLQSHVVPTSCPPYLHIYWNRLPRMAREAAARRDRPGDQQIAAALVL